MPPSDIISKRIRLVSLYDRDYDEIMEKMFFSRTTCMGPISTDRKHPWLIRIQGFPSGDNYKIVKIE